MKKLTLCIALLSGFAAEAMNGANSISYTSGGITLSPNDANFQENCSKAVDNLINRISDAGLTNKMTQYVYYLGENLKRKDCSRESMISDIIVAENELRLFTIDGNQAAQERLNEWLKGTTHSQESADIYRQLLLNYLSVPGIDKKYCGHRIIQYGDEFVDPVELVGGEVGNIEEQIQNISSSQQRQNKINELVAEHKKMLLARYKK